MYSSISTPYLPHLCKHMVDKYVGTFLFLQSSNELYLLLIVYGYELDIFGIPQRNVDVKIAGARSPNPYFYSDRYNCLTR